MSLWKRFKDELTDIADKATFWDNNDPNRAIQVRPAAPNQPKPQTFVDSTTDFVGGAAKKGGDILGSIGKSIAEPYQYLSEGVAESLAYDSQAMKDKRASEEALDKTNLDIIKRYGEVKRDPTTDPAKLARWEKLYKQTIADSDQSFKDRAAENAALMAKTDPVKGAAAVGSIGLDIATAGMGTAGVQGAKVAGKQATKEVGKKTAKELIESGAEGAAKQAIIQSAKQEAKTESRKAVTKELVKQGAKTGAIAAPGGVLAPVVTDGTEARPLDMAAGGAAAFLFGGAIPTGAYGVSKGAGAISDVAGNIAAKGGDLIEAAKTTGGEVVEKGKRTIQEIMEGTKPKQLATENVNVPKVTDADKTITIRNYQTGDLSYYKPKTDEEYQSLVKQIDGDRVTSDGIAGIPDSKGNVVHVTAGGTDKLDKAGYKQVDAIPDERFAAPTPAEVLQPAAGTVRTSSTKAVGDLMPDLAARRAAAQSIDPTQELATKYGLKPETVTRLQNQYGVEKANNIIARSSDATNIRSMDAFVVSEAKKAYGTPNTVKTVPNEPPVQNAMTAEELASLDATAPGVAPRVDLPVAAPVKNTTPVVEPIIQPTPKINDAPPSNLGKIAQSFYDGKQGNQKIGFKDLERLGQTISKQVDADLQAAGTTFSDVARIVQEGARNGVKNLDEILPPEHAAILRNAQEEMNYIRRRASTGKKEVGAGDLGEMYLPQQKAGERTSTLFEDFRATKPGNENTRKNAIELEDLDYSPDVIGQYITRYGDTKLYREERLARALAKRNEGVPEDQLAEATQDLIRMQDQVNTIKTKIGAFGFGIRSQTDEAGKVVDTAGELSKIGMKLGHGLDVITDAPKGLTNGDRINSVATDGIPLGDRLGLNQYRDAESYASKQFVDSGGDRNTLATMVGERLQKQYNLLPEDIEYAVQGISRIAPTVPDEVVLARVTSTYRNAAKQQLMEELQHVDIQNPKLRKDVSTLTNQILREGSLEAEAGEKITRTILTAQNALFRKLNVSSALNELSDLNSFISVYGKNIKLVPDFKAAREFGLGDIDAAIEPYIKQAEAGTPIRNIIKGINNSTNLYKFIEHYKAGVVATTARDFYSKQGLQGDALTAKVLDDYRTLALPVDAFTKTVLDNAPLYTQYMTWGLRNLQKEGKLATGKIDAGILSDKTTMERIARNAYANLPAKTVFWLSSNALKGTGILTAFGLTDFTGMTNQDYSGIAEEDKSWFDRTTQFTNSSTTLSMLNSIIQSFEKEGLKQKYADADYNPYENNELDKDIIAKYTPQFIKNISGASDLQEKGYSENKAGRVQYEAPTDWWNTTKSFVFGKGQTDNARDYSGRESFGGRILNGDNPIEAIVNMGAEQLGIKEGDYNRPLTEEYSDQYKALDDGARTELLKGGRQYNKYLDDLKKGNKEAYDNYISALDGNHVDPEYWRSVTADGKLETFNMMRNRKKQAAKDLGKAYDPLYDLTDEQAKSVLQQKSAPTGDDLALRNALYKEQWYQDYMDKVKGYYDSKTETDSEFTQTQRVRDWYDLNDQYNGLRTTTTDDGKEPEWAKAFPLVYQQKLITDQYGFGSEEGTAWFKANADAYAGEKELYDQENLNLINKMRAIEGYPPMSPEQYQQVTEVADTDGDSKKKSYGSGGGGGGGVSMGNADFGSVRTAPDIKVSKTQGGSVKIKSRNRSTKGYGVVKTKKA